MLIMVDDERLALRRARAVEMRKVRFRTLGCYPLTGAIESNAATIAADHRRDARGAHLRARRAA